MPLVIFSNISVYKVYDKVSPKIATAWLCMSSFVTESCPKTQRYKLYLKTVNTKNEIETGEAVNKTKYIYTIEKLKLYSAIHSLYRYVNIVGLSYQFNSLANSNTEYWDFYLMIK